MREARLGAGLTDSNFDPKKFALPAGRTAWWREMLFRSLRVIDDREPRSAAMNMALDEVLFRAARNPTLRAYRWAGPAISFGYFEKYAEVRAQFPDRELVRRWTGGGVVDHAEDFTYSLAIPGPVQTSSREIYQAVHLAVAAALGPAAKLCMAQPVKTSNACFENPVVSDVELGGEKVAGAAIRRTRQGLLLQGSVSGKARIELTNLAEYLSETTYDEGLANVNFDAALRCVESRYGSVPWALLR